jgi:hypothetical protein
MGVFGVGLYSSDFAMDLRGTIGAVARLPFDANSVVDILRDTEPSAANDPNNEDHTTFWLVMADQFAKRGIVHEAIRDKALTIIDGGEDIVMMEKLGMKGTDLRKRRKFLETVRARIVEAPALAKRRSVLTKPQPLLMERGDVLIYPTCNGKCINPYYPSKESNVVYTKDGPSPWIQSDWGAMFIVDSGRAFDFLSWYRALIVAQASCEQPSLDSLLGEEIAWKFSNPGTCSPSHFRKMELKKIGSFDIDLKKRETTFPMLRPGTSAAVQDISIANQMNTISAKWEGKPLETNEGHRPTILGIKQILNSDSVSD